MLKIHYIDANTTHNADFVYELSKNHSWWLIIQTHTPAVFRVNSKEIAYPANQIVLYTPETPAYYRACADQYVNDWIRFDTNELEHIEQRIPIGKPIQLSEPDYTHKLFELLTHENYFNHNNREQSLHHLFQLLISKIAESASVPAVTDQFQLLQELRYEIHNHPEYDWTVPLMAERMHVSAGHLQLLYQKNFGISCMNDVIDNRIRLAKISMTNNHFTLQDIALLRGYHTVEHFSRQFKLRTGVSPSIYRDTAI